MPVFHRWKSTVLTMTFTWIVIEREELNMMWRFLIWLSVTSTFLPAILRWEILNYLSFCLAKRHDIIPSRLFVLSRRTDLSIVLIAARMFYRTKMLVTCSSTLISRSFWIFVSAVSVLWPASQADYRGSGRLWVFIYFLNLQATASSSSLESKGRLLTDLQLALTSGSKDGFLNKSN